MTSHPILDLQKRCYDCRECPLGRKKVAGHDPHVFACGKPDAEIMFIGEAPGGDEVLQRTPLVGRAGQFFNSRILDPAGLSRREVYVTNAVLCRPDERNRTPHLGEVELCRPILDAQIVLVKPKLLVTLGNIPLWATCKIQKITKNRGTLRWSREWSDGRKIPVFPMFHPSYCLRGAGLKETADDAELLRKMAASIRGGALDQIMVNEDLHVLCDMQATIEAGGANA